MWHVGVAYCQVVCLLDIADLAEKNQQVLVPDEGAQYDQVVEIDLDNVSERGRRVGREREEGGEEGRGGRKGGLRGEEGE